ncbi:head-tail adaptor protein [Xanthobacter sp. DSM 24535]|uniref:head-tail adaptor protein n=1 Tax=Roseixanthobacter psychrophilus TaxID=3119917 RepID=UPI003729A1EF
MTSAGDLRERIRFEKRAAANDGAGNTKGDWQAQFTVAAKVQPLKGGEGVLAGRLAGSQPVIIIVRSSAATRQISPAWRAVDARTGVIYALTGTADMAGDRAFIDILAVAGPAT